MEGEKDYSLHSVSRRLVVERRNVAPPVEGGMCPRNKSGVGRNDEGGSGVRLGCACVQRPLGHPRFAFRRSARSRRMSSATSSTSFATRGSRPSSVSSAVVSGSSSSAEGDAWMRSRIFSRPRSTVISDNPSTTPFGIAQSLGRTAKSVSRSRTHAATSPSTRCAPARIMCAGHSISGSPSFPFPNTRSTSARAVWVRPFANSTTAFPSSAVVTALRARGESVVPNRRSTSPQTSDASPLRFNPSSAAPLLTSAHATAPRIFGASLPSNRRTTSSETADASSNRCNPTSAPALFSNAVATCSTILRRLVFAETVGQVVTRSHGPRRAGPTGEAQLPCGPWLSRPRGEAVAHRSLRIDE